ncbi:MAG: hypothetical protein IJN97_04890 [Oscillospiraceae bacterium]|nr:hypothetical protein [Oscillospiraceae bacterium]MBQ7054538.1 hypothetical protein [Oscillospiraceae bacterium]
MAEKGKKNNYLEELVEVTLFKDNDKYKDDVYVSLNDEPAIAIKRGVPVKIKRKYALILEESLRQDTAAAEFIQRAAADATKA